MAQMTEDQLEKNFEAQRTELEEEIASLNGLILELTKLRDRAQLGLNREQGTPRIWATGVKVCVYEAIRDRAVF